MTISQEQLLAFAVYEIRTLLAGYLGSECGADPAVRAAAHLSYALHNHADAALQGKSLPPETALSTLATLDRLLGTDFQHQLTNSLDS